MATTIKSESRISREHAAKILRRHGWEASAVATEMARGQDYTIFTDTDGGEHLFGFGESEPTATNDGTSWLT